MNYHVLQSTSNVPRIFYNDRPNFSVFVQYYQSQPENTKIASTGLMKEFEVKLYFETDAYWSGASDKKNVTVMSVVLATAC